MPLPLKPFYMMRHGQTEANAARVMAGHRDSPLTALGRAQAVDARRVVESLNVKPEAIFHSNLSRARDTALIINQALNVELFEDPDLAELHAGDLEGESYDKCKALFNSWPRVLNGEDPKNFFKRVKRGKTRALSGSNDPVLIVCHGGVMRAFGALYNLPIPGRFKNAHLYEFIPNAQKPSFPWDVFDYAFCPEKQNIIKSRSTIYDSPKADSIA